jgi:hypothetical protein
MSSSTSVRNTYSTAAGRRSVEVVRRLSGRAGEVDDRRAGTAVHGDCDTDDGPCVELVRALAVVEVVEHAAHGLCGVVLHVGHVRLHGVEAELFHHRQQR